MDEVVPGREAGRAEAAEDERGRLAADLHAEVLPSLRRALVEAEAGGTVERLAADLRAAVDEVESLLVSRRSIVLEELGLLAAVEWLAERVEDRSAVRVEIEVGAADADGGRPPREVERAAFRVAQLALDNVVRHAPGATATVAVAASAAGVRLRIDGRRRRAAGRRGRGDPGGPPGDRGHARRGARLRRARWTSGAARAAGGRPSSCAGPRLSRALRPRRPSGPACGAPRPGFPTGSRVTPQRATRAWTGCHPSREWRSPMGGCRTAGRMLRGRRRMTRDDGARTRSRGRHR